MMHSINKQIPIRFPSYSIRELLKEYILDLEAANRSPKTISRYMYTLNGFADFLQSNGITKPVSGLGRKEVNMYTRHLQNSRRWSNKTNKGKDYGELSTYTIQGQVRDLKAFWSWLFKEGYIDSNPLSGFPLPRVKKIIINTISIEQFKQLISQLDKSTSSGMMYYCILLLLMDTGMRISELVSIEMENIDIGKSFVKVLGKGQKERVVPITKASRKELIKYIRSIRIGICRIESSYLFPTRDGEHITVNGVQQAIRRLAKKAGLQDVKCHPHIFRHTFATHFIAKGGSETALQNILGHESSQTIKKYVHLQPSDLKKQQDKYSPLTELFGY